MREGGWVPERRWVGTWKGGGGDEYLGGGVWMVKAFPFHLYHFHKKLQKETTIGTKSSKMRRFSIKHDAFFGTDGCIQE